MTKEQIDYLMNVVDLIRNNDLFNKPDVAVIVFQKNGIKDGMEVGNAGIFGNLAYEDVKDIAICALEGETQDGKISDTH